MADDPFAGRIESTPPTDSSVDRSAHRMRHEGVAELDIRDERGGDAALPSASIEA